ncbi:MAG: 4Fe-4S dicluster domain-containing protein [Synergistaceae bacterium]|jgi:Fe-S-cluster-containing hydrogenase component 2|nr:4Fe-4S dicluster domain-containing protein [Synergistaceae bacterium]
MASSNLPVDRSFESGVLNGECPGAVLPPECLWKKKKNGFALIECPQRIPCNPCATSCPAGAVRPFADINDVPRVDYEKCTGCALCVAACPGLACFVVDLTYGEDLALVKLPYEMLPVPSAGDEVDCVDRTGGVAGRGSVVGVSEPLKDHTRVVSVSVKKDIVSDVRAIRTVN